MTLCLEEIELFLLDMDGTFYLGDQLLPGALDFVQTIRDQAKKFIFLTNNSSKSQSEYATKLRRLGVDVQEDDIFTSGEATAIFIRERYGPSKVYLIGTQSLAETFRQYGHEIVVENPQIVVLGYDTQINYEKLARGCLFLRKGLDYIATHPDINCPSLDGPVPDAGSFIALIERSTGRKPDFVVGKPNSLMLQMIAKKTGTNPEKIAMVGDRLYTDMEFARRSKIFSVLVLSGETTLKDLESADWEPDLVLENIGELAKMLKGG
ncbi:HAD-IIA family hydrolase [Pseudothermotoga sp. U03pept]|uniref:HAD-IIA family hydrolase n=1 Tax=Pseudothermotoga sp. U03pept TaxID=3447012 RepID=UPI003F0862E5